MSRYRSYLVAPIFITQYSGSRLNVSIFKRYKNIEVVVCAISFEVELLHLVVRKNAVHATSHIHEIPNVSTYISDDRLL